MTSVKTLDDAIADQQRGMDAVQSQIETAQNKGELDLAAGLQKQATEHSRQISNMQSERTEAVEREKQEAAKEAAERQKEEDKGISASDFF